MNSNSNVSSDQLLPVADAVVPLIDEVLDQIFGSDGSCLGPWALLDFPSHSNVGDSAIWLGTLAILLKRFGAPPTYVTRHKEFPTDLVRLLPHGPILLHGGGNFGDLWQGFWQNRVAILNKFSHRSIVQMPQSIHFSDLNGEALQSTQRAISAHPDFTLLVRDRESLAFAQANFDCQSYLCPDMAFGLRQLASNTLPEFPVLALMRDDTERKDNGYAAKKLGALAHVTDWIGSDKPLLKERMFPGLVRAMPRLRSTFMAKVERTYNSQALWHVKRGCDILGQGNIVVTDRLHGHIMCCLMSKKHVVLDNSYGKVARYINAWPDDGMTIRAGSADEAVELLKGIS